MLYLLNNLILAFAVPDIQGIVGIHVQSDSNKMRMRVIESGHNQTLTGIYNLGGGAGKFGNLFIGYNIYD